MKSVDIVKQSEALRRHLRDRLEELKVTYQNIIDESKKYKMSITKSNLSIYFNRSENKGILTQRQIIWMCFRYGITIFLTIEKIPYDEKACIKKIKEYFSPEPPVLHSPKVKGNKRSDSSEK